MATSKKITELPAITAASNTDVLYIVHDPAGVPVSNKITVQNLLKSVNTYLIEGKAAEAYTNSTAYTDAAIANMSMQTAGTVTVQQRYFDYVNNELYGTTDLTAVTGLQEDDVEHEIILPFNVTFLGRAYDRVWINSNSYLTFGSVGTSRGYAVYFAGGPGNFGVPAIMAGVSDRQMTAYYYGATNDGRFVIRYEGVHKNWGGDGNAPNRIWEIWFHQDNPGVITLVVRDNNDWSGVWGIHDGTKWIDVYDSLPKLDQNSDGQTNNSIEIHYSNSSTVADFRFVGSGVETYVEGNSAYVEINPLQGFIDLTIDGNTDDTVLTSAYYGLNLRSTHDAPITLESAGEVHIHAADGTEATPGPGKSVYITSGDAHGNSTNFGHEGGNVNIIAGLSDAGGHDGNILLTTSGTYTFTLDKNAIQPPLGSLDHAGSGRVLELGTNDQQIIITGPAPTIDSPTAQRMVIQGQKGVASGEGGDIYLWAGHSGDQGGSGGDLKMDAGTGYSSSEGGTIKIRAGGSQGGQGGFVEIWSGSGATGAPITMSVWGTTSAQWKQWVYNPDGTLTLPPSDAVGNGAYLSTSGSFNINVDNIGWKFSNSGSIDVHNRDFAANVVDGGVYFTSGVNQGDFSAYANGRPAFSYIYTSFSTGAWLGSQGKNDVWHEWNFDTDGTMRVPGKITNNAEYRNNSALTLSVNDFGSQSWFSTYGDLVVDNFIEGSSAVKHDADGNLYVAGYGNGGVGAPGSILLIKYNKFGELLWQKVYYVDTQTDTYATDMYLGSDGTIYVCSSYYNGGHINLTKFANNGDILWNGTLTGLNPTDVNINAMASDGNGNFYIGGFENIDNVGRAYVVKIDATGELPVTVWKKFFYEASYNAYVSDVSYYGDSIYIVGKSGSNPYCAKISAAGDIVWQTYFNSETNSANPIAIDVYNGTLFVVSSDNNNFLITKIISADGTVGDSITVGPGANFSAVDIKVDGNGNVYVLGGSFNGGITLQHNQVYDTIILMKLDSLLEIQYQRIFSNQAGSVDAWWAGHACLSIDDDSNYLAIAGYTNVNPNPALIYTSNYNMLTIQIPTNGSLPTGQYSGLYYDSIDFSPAAATISTTPGNLIAEDESASTLVTDIIIHETSYNNELFSVRTSFYQKEMSLEATGNLRLPVNGDIIDSDGVSPLRDVPQRKVLLTNYTLERSDRGKHVFMTSRSTVFVPNTDIAELPLGTTIAIVSGAHDVGILPQNGVSIYNNGQSTYNEDYYIGPYTMATLFKFDDNTWILSAPVINSGWIP